MSDREQKEVFHADEVNLHKKFGVEDCIRTRGMKVIRSYMPDQHRKFFTSLKFIVIGALDSSGNPWVIIRTVDSNIDNLISSPNDRQLIINSQPLPGEPSDLALGIGDKISIVGLEVETRRRNRLNGTIIERTAESITVRVDQSYGNCAQYIQQRTLREETHKKTNARYSIDRRQVDQLSKEVSLFIRNADTFFISSRAKDLNDDPRAGIDVNHRGGRTGFVKILPDNTLILPDYSGNNFFNTLGNIQQDNRVGLLFPDFKTGNIFSMTGNAKLVLSDKTNAKKYGSERYIRYRANQCIISKQSFPIHYNLQGFWPMTPESGSYS